MFSGRAVDSALLYPVSAISSQLSAPTTQEEAVLTYNDNASKMKLAAHSEASYFSEPKAHSRAGGHFFLWSDSSVPHNNGAVLNIAHPQQKPSLQHCTLLQEKQFTF